uniref:PAS domain-containing protein n=1 Tax=Anopheles atroparvus TaxID=41427 RepID=A0A182J1P8_ANOAO
MADYVDVMSLKATEASISGRRALSGFLMMLTQNGKLLYISDNAAEYLGHSMLSCVKSREGEKDIILNFAPRQFVKKRIRSYYNPRHRTAAPFPSAPERREPLESMGRVRQERRFLGNNFGVTS